MTNPVPRVRTGLDRLLEDDGGLLAQLHGRRVALLVNPTSVQSATLDHAIDALLARGVDVVRLFGPEHGVRAEAQDMEAVDGMHDPVTNLPTVSLYGATETSLRPRPGDLDGLDLVLADIQDVGARYYTYAYTIGLMMDACGQAGIPCWVLDRPNPLGGLLVEGNIVHNSLRSFVGMQPLATRHGMTMGELARFFQRHGGWRCELEVVTMQGWRRSMWFDDTGVPWVMPSPNMPTLDTATVYPGQCLLEGSTLSEGRGTTLPFELFGDPELEAPALRQRLQSYDLPGLLWREVSFRPMFQKHTHQTCQGLQLHVTNRQEFRPLATSLAVLSACRELSDGRVGWRQQAYEFVHDRLAIDLLLGDEQIRQGLESGVDPLALARAMDDDRGSFDEQRRECLLYHEA